MPQPSPSNTPLLEAAAMSGAHFRRCTCGTILCTQDRELFHQLVAEHECPAGPLDIFVDRVCSIPGLVALTFTAIVITTAAFLLGSIH